MMNALRKNSFPFAFFAIIITSSCILFNNKSYLNEFEHTEQITTTDINFFGKPNFTRTKKGSLLLLVNKDLLKCVVYNKNKKDHLFAYSKINDSSHLLVAKQFWAGFARYTSTTIDSVLFEGNFCIRKKGTFDSKSNQKYYVTNIEAFKLVNEDIECYNIAGNNLRTFGQNSMESLMQDIIKGKLFLHIQESKKLTKQTFFRERIINK